MALLRRRENSEEQPLIQVTTPPSEGFLHQLAEQKRTGLDALVPLGSQMRARIPLVTAFRGRAPDLIKVYRAHALIALREHLRNPKETGFDLTKLDPIEWLKEHAPSVNQERAKQIVEIARSTNPPEESPRGWRRGH